MSCRVSLESLSSRVSSKARYGDWPGFMALWRLGTDNMKLQMMFWNTQHVWMWCFDIKYTNRQSTLPQCIKYMEFRFENQLISPAAITYLQKALWSQVLKFPRSTAQALPKSNEMQIPNSSPILNKEKEKENIPSFIHTDSTKWKTAFQAQICGQGRHKCCCKKNKEPQKKELYSWIMFCLFKDFHSCCN